jgi:hypothetical protein
VTKLRALFLLLGFAAFVLAGASLAHLHASGELGLWNQEHDLGLMAALGSAAAQLDAAPVVALALALLLTPALRADRLASAPLSASASRAPPAR